MATSRNPRSRSNDSHLNLSRTFRNRSSKQRNARLRLQYELLEPRHLLASDLDPAGIQPLSSPSSASSPSAPFTWFETLSNAQRVPLTSLASVDRHLPEGIAGPQPLAIGEWIVQLTDDAASRVRSLHQANALFDDPDHPFTIISGLGFEGGLLVRGEGFSKATIEASLRANQSIETFSLNQLIQGQATTPNESDFAAGLLPGLNKINATAAWDETIGSMSTVVGVVDTGIDSTHPDLYLNIWINQGELPPKFLDEVGPQLVDIDGDGLITFYDLNNVTRATTAPYSITVGGFASGPNAEFVRDLNHNGRIDAQDLLADANWADGRDTDNNGFFDDLFGVNFRVGAGDPFASNNPSDPLGHGTHVSGTIGAIGGNDTGVVGVNWQTSLMSLRILDDNNQGDSGAAIRAVNYAREMRERYRVDTTGRVTQGANVRVLNNSWGQPGGYEASLEAAIQNSTDTGILFVAAAGNGNFLGQGVDNDRTPFYPASYDVDGVIAVAASDSSDRPATFSNFGAESVDLFAPGVGIRSTLPGGGYGSANGTSMAAPYVSGTAALVWSAFPEATVAEVQQAILSKVTPVVSANSPVSSSGRLDSDAAMNADVFAPAARLVAKQNITTAGETSTEFTVEYTHRSGIDTTSLGDDDLIVTRQWGPADQLVATLKPNSLTTTATTATATYVVAAPGGSWDALDFGDYVISTVAGKVTTLIGNKTTEARNIGLFNVRINDPSVLYVTTFNDSLEPGSLRSQIIAANAVSPTARMIILESGKYTIDIPAVVDPDSIFGASLASLGIANPGGWTNETTGDFDIQGNITIIGDLNDDTVIDAQALDRVFKIHQDASLLLSRLTIAGGTSPVTQGGGGILSIGNLSIDQTILKKNLALGIDPSLPIFGGAIASWNGDNSINASWITENRSDFGGAFYLSGTATAEVHRSTLDGNWGGGMHSDSSGNATVENSTFSANVGGYGAIANGIQNGFLTANDASKTASLSADGRYVTFASDSSSLVPGDSNRATDIFVYDRITMRIERVSVNDAGEQGNNFSFSPRISADGRYVTYSSLASNLVAGDQFENDIFVYDRTTKQVTSFINNNAPEPVNISGGTPSISDDGRYVAFESRSSNLVPADTNQKNDIFVYDRATMSIERVSLNINGLQFNGDSHSPSISADGRYVAYVSSAYIYVFDRLTEQVDRVSVSDAGALGNGASDAPSLSGAGRYVAFSSTANNLTPGDTNNAEDVFVYDRTTRLIERISVSDAGVQGNGHSDMPSIGTDGRYVTFSSSANNLVPDDTNNVKDIFVYDRTTKLIERVSVNAAGAQGNGDSETPSISADGRYVTYESMASNLVPGDTNGASDIFVYDRTTGLTESTTYRQLRSVIDVAHSTIAFASGSTVNSAVYGDVKVNNSLFASNQVVSDLFTRYPADSSSNNIFSDAPQSGLISPLQRSEHHPPVHFLRAGNPAIDAAASESSGSRDQLEQVRIVPDIGSVEAVTGIVRGKVYVDSNRDGVLNAGEPGLPGVFVTVAGPVDFVVISGGDNSQSPFVSENGDVVVTDLPAGNYQFATQPTPGWSMFHPPLELIRNQSVQGNGNSEAPSLSAEGRYMSFQSEATNLVLGDTNGVSDIFVYDHATKVIERVSVSAAGVQGNSTSDTPSISADGRYVTFRSTASNLVPEDTNGVADVFLYDRLTKLIERVSVSDAGVQSDGESDTPVISGDGRYVTFASWAGNLVPGDTNGTSDIFVYDRTTKRIERASVTDAGVQGNGVSITPSISADGRYVTFVSFSNNLLPGDTNSAYDVFVYDRNSKLIERVSVSDSGEQGNSQSFNPSLSADGRYVTFRSEASNLIPDDTNSARDIFLYDRISRLIERVSASDNGGRGNAFNGTPSLCSDGRFVTFRSNATDLVPDDTNGRGDVFVYDRTTQLVARVSINEDGVQGNDYSDSSSLSADGRYITFLSYANNLDPADNNNAADVFVVPNPLAPPGLPLSLVAGQVYTELNLGLIPNPGTITGRVFEDTVVNGVYDVGEPAISNAIVFLDLDGDGLLDTGERSAMTAADGSYQFLNTDSYRSYSLVVQVPIGFEQISPGASDQFAWNIFLPAAGVVAERDFAIRRLQATGQSSVSVVSGRLFEDRNGNSVFDVGIDVPIGGRDVYLDASNFGVRDASEPRELTDHEGRYSFSGLSARNVAVTTVLDETLVHVNPLGSRFKLEKRPLFADITPFGNPQAIASGDFNQDGLLDVAVALGEANRLSIRLNDGMGGFLPDEIDVDLGTTGAGPTSMVVGQFDGDTKLDVALTANFTGNVTILRNFDPVTKSFASTAYVKVGDEPLDIAAGHFGGDAKADLVVVNKAGNTVQVLTNNGSGVFTAGPAVATGGKNSSSIVVGNFTGDASLDVAVIHASPLTTANPFGGVTLLRGDGAGGLTLAPGYYTVGATPTDAVVGDFNKDGRPDIAVSNFATNSISILLGQADGTLRVQTAILGTASGAFDLTVGDIDNDGDLDVIASNLRDRNISIFRNIGVVSGEVQFEPLENIGLVQFTLAQRMPLVVGNFDNDTSGPGGTGTIDIVTIPQKTYTLHVLKNTLVNGAHRVALTGLNTITGRDFIIKPAILPPSFDAIANPLRILEDASAQSIEISGIKKGREGTNNLRFSALSSHVALTGQPDIVYGDGDAIATVNYTPQPNMSGVAVITVLATESGADGAFDTSDDGVFERSFTVTVLPVNDPPGFTLLGNRNVFQNATLRTVPSFVTAINRGGGEDELGQRLSTFTVTADNSFFTVPPVINAAGTLMFTPSPNKSGPVTVSVMISDNGGRENGGNHVTTKSFVINVLPVNEAPSFTLSATSITVPAAAGEHTVEDFATGFAPGGGADEASQQVSDYVVTTNSPGLFAVLPDVGIDGTLTFTPAIDRSGLATVTVRVRDDGGRANNGVDLSAPLTFTILVQPAPISYSIAAASANKAEGQSASTPTPFTFTVTRSGLTSGIGTVQYAVTGSGSNLATASDFANNVLPQGTITFAAGETSKTLTINVEGDTLVELNEGFVVTLSSPSDSATIATATAVGVIRNDDTSLAIAATDATKPEGHSPSAIAPLTFTVTRSGLTTGTTTVGYKVTSSSLNPVAGADFQGNVFPTGTISFAAGETSKLITIPVVGDTLVEPDERLVVSLHTPSAGATITTTSALGIIQNDDIAFAIAIASGDASATEGQSLTTPKLFPFSVTRTGALSGTDTVNYTVIPSSTNPVTAADFQGGVFPSGTVTFAPGEFRKTLNIPVAGDSLVEVNERFIVSLTARSGQATIIRPNALATILDDDTTFVIAATSANKSEGRSLSTPFTFTITRSGVTTGTSTVGYTVTGVGSTPATANDFTGNALPSGTLTFGPNVKTQVLTINVAGDAIVETDEAFVVTLHTPSVPSTIKTATANGVIRNDDTSFSIAATSAVKPEGQSGVTPFTFTVTRNGLTSGIATVNYAVTPSSLNPVNANDFLGSLFPSGTLIFGAGVSTQVITIPVVGDTVSEADERFVVSLSASSSPTTITAAGALGVIQNDDVGGAAFSGPPLPTGPSRDESNYDLLLNSSESWQFTGVELVGGEVHHRFRQAEGEAEVSFIAPSTFTNPLNRFDVDGNGSVASLDALRIINALSRRTLVDGLGHFLPLSAATAAQFQYLDVNVDAKLTPLDALQVINSLSRQQRQRAAQASSNTLASPPSVFPTTLRAEGESSLQADQSGVQLTSASRTNASPSTVPSNLTPTTSPSTSKTKSASTQSPAKLTASLVDDLFSNPSWGTFDDGI